MVILILGLAAAMVTPQLMDVGQIKGRAAMRRLQGTVQYLFNESVFKKRAFQLHIDIDKGEYWVETPKIDGSTVENVKVEDAFIAKRGNLPDGVKIVDVQSPRLGKRTEGEAVIQFFPHGYVEPATIHLEDGRKQRSTLFINPVTGKMKILPGYVEVTRSG